jgi:hypothetical protein
LLVTAGWHYLTHCKLNQQSPKWSSKHRVSFIHLARLIAREEFIVLVLLAGGETSAAASPSSSSQQ